jgi:hypothetical protein
MRSIFQPFPWRLSTANVIQPWVSLKIKHTENIFKTVPREYILTWDFLKTIDHEYIPIWISLIVGILLEERGCILGLYLRPTIYRVHMCETVHAWPIKLKPEQAPRRAHPGIHQTKSSRSVFRDMAQLDWDTCLEMSDFVSTPASRGVA